MLRVPSSRAVAAPDMGAPPAATTPARANWLAPVNISRDSTHVCATVSPDDTATAPKPKPYAPVATPTARLSRTMPERSAALRDSVTPRG